ncbi:hypothetical protein [Tranquillimonas alkanivorans]|uniref:Uncharacterized protein n=1 Tax=Tranquillimonas alkanivorans TaxID=441119 RepID=A0A1I5NVM0_9RHOB|nr:hypothetical protein [Tranquillimonas alkanivorans]SFP25859.1 hypothetical protein SAMN04488047_104104 [Tranquillimonas alkanivorans]
MHNLEGSARGLSLILGLNRDALMFATALALALFAGAFIVSP